MRRWHSRRLIITGPAVGLLAAFRPPARAAAYALFSDESNVSSFGGSDGPDAWASDWIEIGESDGPDKGPSR